MCMHAPEKVVAFPSKLDRGSKSQFLGKKQPNLQTYVQHRLKIYSFSWQRDRVREEEEEEETQTEKEMESSRWGLRKNNQPNEGTDRKATFDHQLSGSHCPAAFVSLCPQMNPAQGSVALSTAVCLCGLFPRVHAHCCRLVSTHIAVSSSVFVRARAYKLCAICVKAGFISQADKVSKQLPWLSCLWHWSR